MGYKVRREVCIDLEDEDGFRAWARLVDWTEEQIEVCLRSAVEAAAYMADADDLKALYLEKVDHSTLTYEWLEFNYAIEHLIKFGPMEWSTSGQDLEVIKL